MISDPKLHPIFKVRGKIGSPAHTAWNLYVTSDARWEEAEKKGGTQNLRRYILDQSVRSFIDNFHSENNVEKRNRAVSLGYTLSPQDKYNTVTAWETVPTGQEQAQLDVQIDKYQALIAEIEQQIGSDPPTADQADLLRDYKLNLVQLKRQPLASSSGTMGFLEETPSVFGFGGKSIHDANGAPNIDKIRRSTFALDADRPFHLAFLFAQPHEDQQPTRFSIRWDMFKLEFRGGHSIVLSMYAKEYLRRDGSLDLNKVQTDENLLNSYLDQGRLTSVDMDNIQIAKTGIRRLKVEVRTQKIDTDSDAYKPYHRQIQQLEAAIEARKNFKRRMPGAAHAAAQRLIQQLYAFYEKPINLQESSENFYGDEGIVRLTILPQQRGFISFSLNGSEPISIELPGIIETKGYETIYRRSQIIFESNGGSFDWQFMYPAIDSRGEYRLKSVPVPFVIEPAEQIYFTGDWDGKPKIGAVDRTVVDESGEIFHMSPLPGCGICFKVEASPDWTAYQPKYDFIVRLRSDIGKDLDPVNKKDIKNAYVPFLYSLNFFINSGELPERTEVLWNSDAFGRTLTWTPDYPNPNRDNPILDVSVAYDDIASTRRGLHLTLDIHDPNGTADFKAYTDHWCDFKCGLWLPQGDDLAWPPGTDLGIFGVIDYYLDCVIREAVLMNAHNCGMSDEAFKYEFGVDSFWRVRVEDIFSYLDDFVLPCDIVLDGYTLGMAIHVLAGVTGMPESKLAGIATTGNLAGGLIEPSGVGEPPVKVAARGTRVGRHIAELADEYGMTDDYQELRLRSVASGLVMDIASPTSVRTQSSVDGAVPGCNIIRAGAQHVHDWSRFYNIFTVEGKKDRKTGEPLKASYPIPESWLENYADHPLYMGYPKEMPVVKRPELDNKAAVERAVTTLATRNAKSGKARTYDTSWFYPPVYVGDTITADGSDMELIRISSMNIKGITTAGVSARPRVPLP